VVIARKGISELRDAAWASYPKVSESLPTNPISKCTSYREPETPLVFSVATVRLKTGSPVSLNINTVTLLDFHVDTKAVLRYGTLLPSTVTYYHV
jgi:hypothetical protein